MAERLVQLWTRGQRDLAQLGVLRARKERAEAYLAAPGCNPQLGRACLDRARAAYRTHLVQLQAHHREALELLDRLEQGPSAGSRPDASRASDRTAGPWTSAATPPPQRRSYA